MFRIQKVEKSEGKKVKLTKQQEESIADSTALPGFNKSIKGIHDCVTHFENALPRLREKDKKVNRLAIA